MKNLQFTKLVFIENNKSEYDPINHDQISITVVKMEKGFGAVL